MQSYVASRRIISGGTINLTGMISVVVIYTLEIVEAALVSSFVSEIKP